MLVLSILFLLSNPFLSQNSYATNTNIYTKSEIQLTKTSINETTLVKTHETIEDNKQWRFLHPFSAKYSVLSNNKKLGQAIRLLTHKKNQWELSSKAKITKYFIKLKNDEKTQFHIDNKRLVTDYFMSKTKMSFKKEKKMEQSFDWVNKVENGSRGKKTWRVALKEQTFDRVSHLFQLQEDLLKGKTDYSYLISYKGKLVTYRYQLIKTDHVKSPMGELSAVKMLRTKENGDQFVIWLSPDLNYFPIKIAQYDKGEPDITLLIESLNYDKSSQSVAGNQTELGAKTDKPLSH